MRFVKSLLLGCVLAFTASAVHASDPATEGSRLSIPLVNEPVIGSAIAEALLLDPATTEGKRFYRCEQGYDPPCRLVASIGDEVLPAEFSAAELLTATAVSIVGVSLLVLDANGSPVDARNGHGSSANCRIIGDMNGIRYIECG